MSKQKIVIGVAVALAVLYFWRSSQAAQVVPATQLPR